MSIIKNLYKMEVKIADNIVFSNDEVEFNNIYSILINNIKSRNLFPYAIMEDVENWKGSRCWCSSEGYGYTIALITSEEKHLKYFFG